MIFVTHDFGIVALMCDDVAVMYAGKIVEKAHVREIFDHPLHPYTQALMDSVPKLEVRVKRLSNIPGQPPDLFAIPPGCAFKPRWSLAYERCQVGEYPPEVKIEGKEHWVRCWRHV